MIMYWEIGRKKAVSNALWVILVFLLVIVYIPKPGGDTLRLDRMMSTTSRIDNWRYSIRLFMRSSLFGHGFNTLRLVGLRDEAWTLDAEGIESRAGAGIDNSVLYVAASAGTLGLIAYTWLIVSVLALLRPGKTEGIVRPLRAMLIAALIHSMFINSLFYPWIMVWLWILIGVAEFESGRGTIYRW
jgi:O-antigen ligase